MRKLFAWIAGIVGGLVLLVAVVLLSAPLWFDSDGVKTRIVDLLARTTGGTTQFQRIDLRILPLPGATVLSPQFLLPETLELDADSASVSLDLLSLLKAQIRLSSIAVIAPRITVRLAESNESQEAPSVKRPEDAVRDIFTQIADRAPDMEVLVEDGSISVLTADQQFIALDNVQLEAESDDGQVELSVSCSSNFWNHLTLGAELDGMNVAGSGNIDVIGLRVHDLGQMLDQVATWPVTDATTDAKVQWQIQGFANVQARGELSSSIASIKSGERFLDVLNPRIDLSVVQRSGSSEIFVHQLLLEYPRLEASGSLVHAESGTFTFAANARNADLSQLQSAATDFAPDLDILIQPPVQIQQGTVSNLEISATAATMAGLMQSDALQMSLELEQLQGLAPDLDLQFQQAGARVSLAQNKLEIRDVAGQIGNSLLSDGNATVLLDAVLGNLINSEDNEAVSLKSRIEGQSTDDNAAPDIAISADANLNLDLAETLAIAKRIAGTGEAGTQFNQIEQLTGAAKFRASIAMSAGGDPEVQVNFEDVQTKARHKKIPFVLPVRVKRGAIVYANDALQIQDMSGAIGLSSFGDVNARIAFDEQAVIRADKGSARLSLDELIRWTSAMPELSEHLRNLEQISGSMNLSLSALAGPLTSPEKLRYVFTASPEKIIVNAPNFGPRMRIDRGTIDVSNKRVRILDVNLSSLDSFVRVGGALHDYRDGMSGIDTRIEGDLGLESLEWLRKLADLPEDMRLRNPVQVSRLDINWRSDATLATRGKLEVNNGPSVGFAMRFSEARTSIEHVSVRDDFSDVDAGGEVDDTRFDIRFKGNLVEKTLSNIFVQLPFTFGELSGDIRATGDWQQPKRSAANGTLQGKMIALPDQLLAKVPAAVTIENFSIEGQDQTLLISAATVAVDDSRLDVSGKVGVSGQTYFVDADINSKDFVVPLPVTDAGPTVSASDSNATGNAENSIERIADQGESKLTLLEATLLKIPGTGQVRINIGKLHIGDRELIPFVAAVTLEDERLVLRLRQARLCNILLTGGVTAVLGGHAALDVDVRTRDAPIERSIPCLTKQNILLTGLMDADANVVASGTGREFLHSLRATYALAARDGQIRKFDALDEVIDAVNETDAADKQKLPEVSGAGLIYKNITAKGHVDLETLRFKEIVVELDAAKMVAQGSLDIATEQLNATVLVAPLKTIDKIVTRMPILGRIFGGSVLAVPVGLSGTISDPVVLPLSPTAVASRMVDILTNTLSLPADLLTSPNSGSNSSANGSAR